MEADAERGRKRRGKEATGGAGGGGSLTGGLKLKNADPVKATSPHLYHPSYGKEIKFDQYVEVMDRDMQRVSVHRRVTKKAFGCDKRLYDSGKHPVRREPTPNPSIARHRPLSETEASLVDRLVRPIGGGLTKPSVDPDKKDSIKLSADDVLAAIARVSDAEAARRKRQEENLFNKLEKEREASAVVRSKEEVAEITQRLYQKAGESSKAAVCEGGASSSSSSGVRLPTWGLPKYYTAPRSTP